MPGALHQKGKAGTILSSSAPDSGVIACCVSALDTPPRSLAASGLVTQPVSGWALSRVNSRVALAGSYGDSYITGRVALRTESVITSDGGAARIAGRRVQEGPVSQCGTEGDRSSSDRQNSATVQPWPSRAAADTRARSSS